MSWEKRSWHQTYWNENLVHYHGYHNVVKKKKRTWQKGKPTQTFISIQRYNEVRAHNTNPQILTLNYFQSSCSCITQKQCRQRKEHWTRRGIWLVALNWAFSSATLDTSLNLSESFSFLVYKMGTISVFPNHKGLYFKSKPQGLKCFCIYHCYYFLATALVTELSHHLS